MPSCGWAGRHAAFGLVLMRRRTRSAGRWPAAAPRLRGGAGGAPARPRRRRDRAADRSLDGLPGSDGRAPRPDAARGTGDSGGPLARGLSTRPAGLRYGPGSSSSTRRWTAPSRGGPGGARAGTVHLGGTLEELAARSRGRHGREPERPYVLVVQPSFDPRRAPAGQDTGWAYCHVPTGSTRDMTDVSRPRSNALHLASAS